MRGLGRLLGEVFPYLQSPTGLLVVGVLLLPVCILMVRRDRRQSIAPVFGMFPAVVLSAGALSYATYATWGLFDWVRTISIEQRGLMLAVHMELGLMLVRASGAVLVVHAVAASIATATVRIPEASTMRPRLLLFGGFALLGVGMVAEAMHGMTVFTAVARAAAESKVSVAQLFWPFSRLLPLLLAGFALSIAGMGRQIKQGSHLASLVILAAIAALAVVAWRGVAVPFAQMQNPIAPSGRLYVEEDNNITLPTADLPKEDEPYCLPTDPSDVSVVDGRPTAPDLTRRLESVRLHSETPEFCLAIDAGRSWRDVMSIVNAFVDTDVQLYLQVRVPDGAARVAIPLTSDTATAVLSGPTGTAGAVHSAGPELTVGDVVQAVRTTDGLRMAADPVVVDDAQNAGADNGSDD